MPRPTDIRIEGVSLHFIPVPYRASLRFGTEAAEGCTCARVRLAVAAADGRRAEGWGETPLGVAWAWPSASPARERVDALRHLCRDLAGGWLRSGTSGHALELGQTFLAEVLPGLWRETNAARAAAGRESMPWLAALLCASPFDLALHDAYGKALGLPAFSTYGDAFMNRDLAALFGEGGASPFRGRFPKDFLRPAPAPDLEAWHLAGGADPLEEDEGEPGPFPRALRGWLRRDGITAVKVKLLGADPAADADRLAAVSRVCLEEGVRRLGIDFNCTVKDPRFVLEVLDRLRAGSPAAAEALAYVEQPFPIGFRAEGESLHRLAERAPLLLDEGCPGWESVAEAKAEGWTGVVLKTCKTLTGSLLTAARARAAGMAAMVQDLTNPMLALPPHALLAANVPTLGGIEVNAAQYCPEASSPEAAYHPRLYRRERGRISLATLTGPGLGYAGAEGARALPAPDFEGAAA